MSNIEWTDETWNPVVGCTRKSVGCDNCYAVVMTHRLEGMERARRARNGTENGRKAKAGEKYVGLTVLNPRGERHFNGVVRCVPEALAMPLKWKKPRRVFVNSMSDLFHESVPFEFIDRVFAVMALTPQHTFQILTKRLERMVEYFASFDDASDVDGAMGLPRLGNAAGKMLDGAWIWGDGQKFRTAIEHFISDAYEEDDEDTGYEAKEVPWPLPNVWLGTSCENQEMADVRVPWLLKCPAAVRFLSCEPLLGPIDLKLGKAGDMRCRAPYIKWVIVGGESGADARPCSVEWVRSIVGQCRASGMACFVKQLGARVEIRNDAVADWEEQINAEGGAMCLEDYDVSGVRMQGDPVRVRLADSKGGEMAEWPEDLRVREMPTVGG